jgi:hypothetical protein
MIQRIETKQDFLEFVAALAQDSADGAGWQNGSIDSYLDAMHAWASDSGERVSHQPSWRTFAEILYAGKIYE